MESEISYQPISVLLPLSHYQVLFVTAGKHNHVVTVKNSDTTSFEEERRTSTIGTSITIGQIPKESPTVQSPDSARSSTILVVVIEFNIVIVVKKFGLP
jgi:hypothetical protein